MVADTLNAHPLPAAIAPAARETVFAAEAECAIVGFEPTLIRIIKVTELVLMMITATRAYWFVAALSESTETSNFYQACMAEVAVGFPWVAWVELTFIL